MEKKIIKDKEDFIKWQRMKRDLSASALSQAPVLVRLTKSMLHSAKLPLAQGLQPNATKHVMECGHHIRQLDTGMGSMRLSIRQVTETLGNVKLHPLENTVPPNTEKKDLESSNKTDQKERLKGSTPLRPAEDNVKTVFSKSVKKMGCRSLTLPMSPAEALKDFQDHLTNFEQKEILNFPEIWFLGQGAEKIKGSREIFENSEDNNSNYDVNGVYTMVLHDHIAYRYEVLEKLGQGSFGLVLKCLDHKTKELVAVKVIHNIKSAKHMAMKELEILDVIRREDQENRYNVIHMKEHMYFRNHICIVFELQGTDLFKLIKKNNFHGLSFSQTHHYATSLVTTLQMLHRHKIIHCDLKPENILLPEKGHRNIKVADFGCSFYEYQKGYSYVQTRFYRAPEVILGLPFGTAIDMWSLGCILAELYTGIPLFSGTNEADQLACIMEVLGMPPEEIVQAAPRKMIFLD